MPSSIPSWTELIRMRGVFLEFEGPALVEIHGWLIGVVCAIERKRKSDPGDMDRLIAELRASTGPPDWPAGGESDAG